MSNDEIELVVRRLAAGCGRQVRSTSLWLQVDRDPAAGSAPAHGWKLHISARSADLAATVEKVVPLLLAEGCTFKLARSAEMLTQINDGNPTQALVGKAFTVYPSESSFGPLAKRLAELLRGRPAPRVLSDRQVQPDAPVYYRYGPFRQNLRVEPDGKVVSAIVGPDGERFDGTAELNYRQPSWAEDPFGGQPDRHGEPVLLGQHYRPGKGLFRSARGNVYLATDTRTDATVVVKQARAYVSEDKAGFDTRLRLRNERYVLTALADVAGIPRFLDHFRHSGDEFLVTNFAGKFNLAEDVARRGRYRPLPSTVDDPATRSLDSLARRLSRIVVDIHDRGFISRDISPGNIVVDDDTFGVTLIDFGICHHGDVRMVAGTPGIAPERQFTDAAAHPSDDCHSLGMVLLQAATGAGPAVSGPDAGAPRRRALQMIDRIYGANLPPSIVQVIGLLSDDPDEAVASLRAIASRKPPTPVELTERAPSYTTDLLDRTRENVLSAVNARLDEPDGFVEPNVYRGISGIGLELLHHLTEPGVADTVRRMQDYCAQSATRLDLPPGLFLGATGVEIFLQQARSLDCDGPTRVSWPAADWRPEGDEITIGAAGVGLGHLMLAELAPHPEHERVIRLCLDQVSRQLTPQTAFVADDLTEESAMDPESGFAHGRAGVVALSLAARNTPYWTEPLEEHLAELLDLLRVRASRLVELSAAATAVPLAVSWCRGLAGIGRTLLTAGRQLRKPDLVHLAIAAGDACVAWIPYLANRGQCCGISGVGEFFLDLAGEADRFDAAARSAATQLVVRGLADPPPTAAVVKLGEQDGIAWSGGIAGELAFLRRLRDRDTGNYVGPF